MSLLSLEEIAKDTMQEKGFKISFPQDVLHEMENLPQTSDAIKDLRQVPFFSIDNDTSLDLDQLTYAEKLSEKSFKAVIAIADVASFVQINSATDNYASFNTTSVYTPTKVFSMLPKKLSHGVTSLLPNEDRAAIIVEVAVNEFGESSLHDLYFGLVRNHEKLTYDSVASFLEKKIALPIKNTISEQLLLQDHIAQRLKQYRSQNGSIEFAIGHVQPVIQHHQVVAAVKEETNRAREIIENFMIAANLSCNSFLRNVGYPRLCRTVKTPKNWPRIVEVAKEKNFNLPLDPDPYLLNQFLSKMRVESPDTFSDLSLTIIKLLGRGEYTAIISDNEGLKHFGLNMKEYTHATAPNRRFADLAMNRLIKAAFNKLPSPYSLENLAKIAEKCTEMEAKADKVERKLNKCAIARLFINRIGEKFSAVVTGSSDKGVWVRIFAIPIEGKLVKYQSRPKVGDKIAVCLIHVNPLEGFIDFAMM